MNIKHGKLKNKSNETRTLGNQKKKHGTRFLWIQKENLDTIMIKTRTC